ncbi:hypothetical protein I4U23_005347 [Adineta vaga]|nr:hypothetical protein I4U23_005347 [Adineta vaga]
MAIECIKEAIDIQRQSLPDNHPNLATMYQTLGDAHYRQGEYIEALTNFQRAYDIYKTMPYCDPLIIAPKLNVDQYDLAMDYFDRAVNIHNEHLHLPYHDNIIGCYIQMGIMERKQGHFEQAHQNFNKAVDTYRCSTLPKQHFLLTKLYKQAALTYLEQDQVEAALRPYEQAIEHTPANFHELSNIRQQVARLHQRNNMTNSNFQETQRNVFYIGVVTIISVISIIIFKTFYKT